MSAGVLIVQPFQDDFGNLIWPYLLGSYAQRYYFYRDELVGRE